MLFIKKCYFAFFLIKCLSFNITIGSDRQLTSMELEEGALTGIYPDWYIKEIETRNFYENIYRQVIIGDSMLDYWRAINYLVKNSHKLIHPLAEVDKIRLIQLIDIVNNKGLSNAEKGFDIDYSKKIFPKPSEYTMNILNLMARNYYLLNSTQMPGLNI